MTEPTCLCNATITPANQHDVEAHLNEHQSFLHQQLEEVCAANKKYVERFEEVRKELEIADARWKRRELHHSTAHDDCLNPWSDALIESTPEGDKGEV